jgi:hypothetical protein
MPRKVGGAVVEHLSAHRRAKAVSADERQAPLGRSVGATHFDTSSMLLKGLHSTARHEFDAHLLATASKQGLQQILPMHHQVTMPKVLDECGAQVDTRDFLTRQGVNHHRIVGEDRIFENVNEHAQRVEHAQRIGRELNSRANFAKGGRLFEHPN